jgi:hypothetical protein
MEFGKNRDNMSKLGSHQGSLLLAVIGDLESAQELLVFPVGMFQKGSARIILCKYLTSC